MIKKYTKGIVFGILILAVAGALVFSMRKHDGLVAPYVIPVAPQAPVKTTTIEQAPPLLKTGDQTPNTNENVIIPASPDGDKNQIPVPALSITMVITGVGTGIPLIENAPLYDSLVAAQKSGLITFTGREYSGLGFFVTDIGTLHGGDGKNLLYYINGKEASVGVSTYIPKNGDVVEWRLN